jgi:hypothetical protein
MSNLKKRMRKKQNKNVFETNRKDGPLDTLNKRNVRYSTKPAMNNEIKMRHISLKEE